MPPLHSEAPASTNETKDSVIDVLRTTLITESVPLARRFRALFSLKHFACLNPPSAQTIPAIEAIAAGFSSPSALVKHELAYCLGQTRNLAAVRYLRAVLEDTQEDPMCRHEAAEALGAIGDIDSVDLLARMRDSQSEPDVVRETCEIAFERIQWENSDQGKKERLQKRYFIYAP